jgi:uncharacterized protein YbbC (DUF1343 family)/CubicO group peptidase (beta-lactamase class C family)
MPMKIAKLIRSNPLVPLLFFCLLLVSVGPGCRIPPSGQPSASQASLFRQEKLDEIDKAVNEAISERKCPGGVLWLEHKGVVYQKAYGDRAIVPAEEPMTADTIFDLASLTKVVATTPAIMLLVERGQVSLDAPVKTYIPEFVGGGKDAVTIRHLMTHTSGLRPGIENRSGWKGQAAAIQKASAEVLQNPPGTVFRYSDINYFVLGEVVQRVSHKPLEQFVATEIYQPLGMKDTGYMPPKSKLGRIAPTEVVEGVPFRGVVHDPTARNMGGVAGHAGLFTTAADLAKYARMLVNKGAMDKGRLFKPETVQLMTQVQTPESIGTRRGLGWDVDSSYSGPRGTLFPLGSYGHTGWTGTSLWVDPFSQSFLIFLSNRNHPDEKGSVLPLRHKLGTLAAEAISDFNFAAVPGALAARDSAISSARTSGAAGRNEPPTAQVLNGIDVLAKQKFAPLKGLRVGLITNHTGQDQDRNPTIDLLKAAPGVELKVLFSPEHGIRGAMDEKIGDSTDEKTGLPVFSLYGEVRKPTAVQLKGLDALVYDIQDIGCRFYTYTSTMGLCLEAAGEHKLKFFVLDRVNPINGATVDGPVLVGKTTFVGFHTVPLRYGMTIGELARMFNEERNSKADLVVIPVQNWKREMYLDHTGLPWTNPSPNMRNLTQAILYPGVGLLESALSVGRGTDTPFEVVGAPYINDVKFAAELNKARLPGVRFVPIRFTPTTSVHKEKECGGTYIMLTDREACNVVDIGIVMAQTLVRMYPNDFKLDKISHLLFHPDTLEAIKSGKPLTDIRAGWQKDIEDFQKRRAKYLLY